MKYLDAAADVLMRHGGGRPMHYRRIAELAAADGLIAEQTLTPDVTIESAIETEIARRRDVGDVESFVAYGRGYYGVAHHRTSDQLEESVRQHNQRVRDRLHDELRQMDPGAFEDLIGRLLEVLGFVDIEVTARSADGGVDVRGTLSVGGVTNVRTAIQVKRWSANVPVRTVRELRGSLTPHERGLIITTSGFSSDALQEGQIADRAPIALVSGEELLRLLIENGIGVTRSDLRMLELDADALLGDVDLTNESGPDDLLDAAPEAREAPSLRRSSALRSSTGKNLSIWPLPGGGTSYVTTAWKMLEFTADTEPRPDEFIDWMINTFDRVTSRKSARSYIEVLRLAGLVETRGPRIALTPNGAACLASNDNEDLYRTMASHIAGLDETIDHLKQADVSAAELLDLLNSQLGTEWQTDSQAFWRLQWLVSFGKVERLADDTTKYRLLSAAD